MSFEVLDESNGFAVVVDGLRDGDLRLPDQDNWRRPANVQERL
jgi:hypothetical protein